MIQRIQSLYLLLVGTLLIITLSTPLMDFFTTDAAYRWDAFGVNTLGENPETFISSWSIFILLCVGSLLAIVTILLFNHRIRQIRFCIFNTALIVGWYAAVAFYYFSLIPSKLAVGSSSIRFGLVLPLVAIILNWLAIRAIGSDEALIRSVDRIRPSRKK